MMQRAIPVAERRGSLPVFRSTTPAQPAAPRADAPMVREDLLGSAEPLTEADWREAAERVGCDVNWLKAVGDVESGRDGAFRRDGVITLRPEPHWFDDYTEFRFSRSHPHLYAKNSRESLRIVSADPLPRFLEMAALDPEAACQATSFGRFQMMGFNARDAGYESARAMVEAMRKSERAQLDALVGFILGKGADGDLRAGDAVAFSLKYNGRRAVENGYPPKLQRAYKRRAGESGWAVLSFRSSGAAVKQLQDALTTLGFAVSRDGQFGAETEAAVREFQRSEGDLAVDGVVGTQTWERIRAKAGISKSRETAPPPPAPEQDVTDKILETVRDVGAAGGAVGAPVSSGPLQYVFIGLIGVAAIALVFQLVRSRFKK